MNFIAIARVDAVGNSQTNVNYSTDDHAPLQGKSYYRLKMIDKDGKSDYSAIRIVLQSTSPIVKIVGNPVQNSLQVITTSNNNGKKWLSDNQ